MRLTVARSRRILRLSALGAAALASCGGAPQPSTLTPNASELQLAQASWEAVHEASDGMAVTYSGAAAGAAATDATVAARGSCWQGALGGQVAGEGQITSADSNFVLTLNFAASACQIGGRTLAGSQQLSTYIHVAPPSHLVYLAGDWVVGLSDGRGWHTTGPDGQGRVAQLSDAGGSIARQHFTLVLNGRRRLLVAGGTDADATQLSVECGVVDPTQAVEVQEVADTGGARLAAMRTLAKGTVVVVDAAQGATASHQFAALETRYAGGCLCPQSGSLQQTIAYGSGRQASYTYTFEGCGQAQVAAAAQAGDPRQAGFSTVSWEDCR